MTWRMDFFLYLDTFGASRSVGVYNGIISDLGFYYFLMSWCWLATIWHRCYDTNVKTNINSITILVSSCLRVEIHMIDRRLTNRAAKL
jgi:hypothetical protein